MRKTWLAAAVLVSASLAWAAARPGVVRTRDGNVFDGLVDEQDTTVVVTVRGFDTPIPRADIASITYGEFDQRWADDYAKLDAKDAKGRVAAGRTAFDNRRYELAEKALRDAQSLDPNNAEAAELLRLTQTQRRLDKPQQTNPGESPPVIAPPADAVPIKPAGVWTTLTPEQINRVKQTEIRPDDDRLRFNFANNVVKRFYEATPGLANDYPTFNDFRSAPAVTQALRIIKEGSAEMAKDVRVTNDPDSIVAFRKDAMPLVLQGCATSGCHGGNNAATAKFGLISPAPDPAAVYTNFYVLQSTTSSNTGPSIKRADGSVEAPPSVATLVDRMRPEMSLVLQYGLPEQMAQMKHPHLRGYNGIYPRGRDDAKYKSVAAFISSLAPLKADYGFEFKLARRELPGATTQP